MKTTIEISDGLLERAKRQAARQGTTLRALVEQGLLSVLRDRGGSGLHRLRKASFGRGGLTPAARSAGWDAIRQAVNQRLDD